MVYWFTIGLAVFELVVLILTNQLKGVGLKRGAAITGWVSLFVGSALIVNSGKIHYTQLSFYLLSITAAIAILAMLFIFVSKDKPQVFLSIFKGFFTLLVDLGWIIGIVMPIILAILGI